MSLKQSLCTTFFWIIVFNLSSQTDRWQQKVDYRMNIHFDVETHQFSGKQLLFYYNNSPDTLTRVFYHLYFNAFQPGSMMDLRSRNIPDPNPKIRDLVHKLAKEETGFLTIEALKQDGDAVPYNHAGTILEVELKTPLLPNSVTVLNMDFSGQVPVQIRRSGRDNSEGIAYSMSQWYPKLCEYDDQGWHANPYIAREFYGVWGDFDVKITIDKNYIIGGTGILQNPLEIGYGYSQSDIDHNGKHSLTWHFKADNVHDFMWAADPDYSHTKIKAEDGTVLRFFYQENEITKNNWEALPGIMSKAWTYINENYGDYPYDQYAFVQGGDGGMEYPMATLITGERRSIGSLVGVSVHELLHSWYQMALATNESLYAWMDEGFTSYASADVMNYLRKIRAIPGTAVEDPHLSSVNGYKRFSKSPLNESLMTHADHFQTNTAYGIGAYTKGAAFLHQLSYIIGEEKLKATLLRYYNTWKFKHPNANDFIRVAEKVSGFELDWFKEYFIQSTHIIDYGIEDVTAATDKSSTIRLIRLGKMPMPQDITITYQDGTKSFHTIPLRIMRGAKLEDRGITFKVEQDWPWTHPNYAFSVNVPIDDIKSVTVDASSRMADVDISNNTYPAE
jgi:hypothetical protein